MWKVEGRGGIWLVRGGAGAGIPRGEAIPRESAAARVGEWFPDGWGREQAGTLAAICRPLTGSFPGSAPPGAGWLRKTVAEALRDGRLTAVRTSLRAPLWSVPEREEPRPAQRTVAADETWIEIVVVDDATGEPVSGARLTLKLPRAARAEHTVPASGHLLFDPCHAGLCEVESDLAGATLGSTLELVGRAEPSGRPLRGIAVPNRGNKPFKIAHVVRHRVRTGETLAALAERAGMTWKELARFNFETDAPKEVNKALRAAVGCSHRTSDGQNYLFHDSDRPGIIYIPRRLEERGLATGQTHVLCVRRMTMPLRPFLFSA